MTETIMRKTLAAAALATGLALAPSANAADFTVEITNLTNGIYFTPFLVGAHPDGTSLFEVGQPASAEIQAMALT